MIIHLYGFMLSKSRVIQGSRERQEKNDLSMVAEIWHHNVSLWRAGAVTQPFNWGSKGEVSTASFPIVSSIKLAISASVLSKHLCLCFRSVSRWFGFAHDPIIFSKSKVTCLPSLWEQSSMLDPGDTPLQISFSFWVFPQKVLLQQANIFTHYLPQPHVDFLQRPRFDM